MYHSQTLPRYKQTHLIRWNCLASLLLFLLSLMDCAYSPQVAENNELVVHAKIRPIDVDPVTVKHIGREALAKIGYDEIIKLADRAGFIEYKYSTSIELISYGSEISAAFTPVFSRYAVAAAVASQADSPLPGPADLAAIGVLVLGIVDAGLLDGYLLNTVTDWLADSGTLLMSENVKDTGVMERVWQIIAEKGLTRTRENVCRVLAQLYKQVEGIERDKVKSTQKGWDCRNTKKERQ